MAKRPDERRAPFPTTDWSLVGHAGYPSDQQRGEALNCLLSRYRPALLAHLVITKQIDSHDADDLVQGFIEGKILERNLIGAADRERGKFRRFLVTAIDNYVANEFRRIKTKKRSADHAIPIDPVVQDLWTKGSLAPDQVFDYEWARQLLREVARRMQQHCLDSQRDQIWAVFESRVLRPSFEGTEPPPYGEIVEKFEFGSPSQASNALITAKRMYARFLREAVAEYVADREEIDAEIDELERILSL